VISVLLDLDGTLVDSAPGILSSCYSVLRTLRIETVEPIDPALVIGPPLAEAMKSLLGRYGDSRVAEAISAYRADYDASGLFKSVAYPGIPSALQNIANTGAHLFVATAKRTEAARKILKHLDIMRFFEGRVYGAEPGGALDHKSELIAHILAKHALSSTESLMVGDRRYDIIGGQENGILTAGALWGYGSCQELQDAGADFLLNTPEDLLPLIQSTLFADKAKISLPLFKD
jgi:phosphoglycolate phosphatase